MRIKNFCLDPDSQKNDCGSAALQGPNLDFGEKKLEVLEKLGKKTKNKLGLAMVST